MESATAILVGRVSIAVNPAFRVFIIARVMAGATMSLVVVSAGKAGKTTIVGPKRAHMIATEKRNTVNALMALASANNLGPALLARYRRSHAPASAQGTGVAMHSLVPAPARLAGRASTVVSLISHAI